MSVVDVAKGTVERLDLQYSTVDVLQGKVVCSSVCKKTLPSLDLASSAKWRYKTGKHACRTTIDWIMG